MGTFNVEGLGSLDVRGFERSSNSRDVRRNGLRVFSVFGFRHDRREGCTVCGISTMRKFQGNDRIESQCAFMGCSDGNEMFLEYDNDELDESYLDAPRTTTEHYLTIPLIWKDYDGLYYGAFSTDACNATTKSSLRGGWST